MISAINGVKLNNRYCNDFSEKNAPQKSFSVNRSTLQTSIYDTRGLQLYGIPYFTGRYGHALKNISHEFRMPMDSSFDFQQIVKQYSKGMKDVINDFRSRVGKNGQFLNWVNLPGKQLEKNEFGVNHLTEITNQAAVLRSRINPDGTVKPLVVLGIGGSKHTSEFFASMAGVGNKGKLHFYSDIDPISFNNFIERTADVKGLNFLVVSKSGTTFETADAFKRFENKLIEAYKKDGMPERDAIAAAQKHFAICTDATPTEKNIRGKIGNKNNEDNNYIKELFIHDDVGGRFSMFDDPSLFALSYAGVTNKYLTRVLKAAQNASERCVSSRLSGNPAALSSIFNTFSRENGFNLVQHNYYGGLFELGAENWTKQLYLESLKDFDYAVGTAPASMHYATEGHFSPFNRNKYNTIMTIMNPKISDNYKKYTGALAQTYNETTPLDLEILEVEGNVIKPEAIGEYIQSTHFKTIYEGMLRRLVKGQNSPDVLPEVLQPSVEAYKNKFKPGSPFELTPGL